MVFTWVTGLLLREHQRSQGEGIFSILRPKFNLRCAFRVQGKFSLKKVQNRFSSNENVLV